MDGQQAIDIFSKNLSYLLQLRDESVKDLSNILGIAYSTVSDWKNGRKMPRAAALQAIADHFSVNISDLLMEDNKEKSKIMTIPLFGDVAAGALFSIDGKQKPDSYIDIPVEFISKYAYNGKLFAMKVNGDSMNKIIPDKSFVIAKPEELSEYKDGDIVIFSHGNGYSIKRFLPHALEGGILFKAETTNPIIKDIFVSKDTIEDLKIWAKIIWYSVLLD
ncbi:LexA family protein [Sporolactobacillus sp. KGMB 08714]|uniref:LexA family protein n=1 Tax=Sporolactobacillus sp. KGMB 08714 TaxID=3064704 RepID=UPI002FBE989B